MQMNLTASSFRERLDVSIVVCCYNAATRLPATLARLARQQAEPGVFREVIVVDNASTDGTAAVAHQNWPADAPAPLRVVTEPRAGLSHARLAGVREARGAVMAFVDDDNWLAPDWVARVAAIFTAHPEVGACGGRSEAVTETSPPAWFEAISDHYAVGSPHHLSGDITGKAGTLLWGAGLSIRKSAFDDLLARGFEFLSLGRTGVLLSSGEDTELCFVLRAMGWHLWYDDELVLSHFIPAARLKWAYAQRLVRGLGAASILVDLYLGALRQPPREHYPLWKQTWLSQVGRTWRNAVVLLIRHPRSCLAAQEGSLPALRFLQLRGRLDMLRILRGRYASLRRQVAQKHTSSAPRVSVVMTVWNGEKHIAEAIASILAQTFRDFELIVVDDGSTDRTCAVVESFHDARIRLERRAHAGIPASANAGVALARGEYVARLDADDVSQPDRLARQVEALDRHPRAVLCFSDVELFGENLFGDVDPAHRPARLCRGSALVRIQMCYRCTILHSSVMYRRTAFQQAGGYPGRPVAEDFDFFTHLIQVGPFLGLPDKLVRYRRHANSTGARRSEEMTRHAREISVQHMLSFLRVEPAQAEAIHAMLRCPPGRRNWRLWFFFCARVLRHPSCWLPEPLGWLVLQTVRNAVRRAGPDQEAST